MIVKNRRKSFRSRLIQPHLSEIQMQKFCPKHIKKTEIESIWMGLSCFHLIFVGKYGVLTWINHVLNEMDEMMSHLNGSEMKRNPIRKQSNRDAENGCEKRESTGY